MATDTPKRSGSGQNAIVEFQRLLVGTTNDEFGDKSDSGQGMLLYGAMLHVGGQVLCSQQINVRSLSAFAFDYAHRLGNCL